MQYGFALPYGSAQMAADLAAQAEKAGWDGIFMGDAIWCEDPMIGLTAAAMTTKQIRLGTMLVPVPLRRPWKLASESVALDRLSGGRLILGIGAGATWMGWQAFPDEITDIRTRAEMLDETIEILTLLYSRKPFDFEGRHYHLKLTALDEMYYPPRPVQEPRVPLWTPGLWPRQKSMQRAMKCDGILVEKVSAEGKAEPATTDDVRAIANYVRTNRTMSSSFDIVMSGKTDQMGSTERSEAMAAWKEAGATWWIETCYDDSEEIAAARIRQGPPR